MKLKTTGTVLLTLADEDKEEALPLIERFAALGFKFASTGLTTKFLLEKGFETTHLGKISEGSSEILDSIRQGHIAYVINTGLSDPGTASDGYEIRKCATESSTTMFTSLDTVRVLLDVLDEITLRISTIDS